VAGKPDWTGRTASDVYAGKLAAYRQTLQLVANWRRSSIANTGGCRCIHLRFVGCLNKRIFILFIYMVLVQEMFDVILLIEGPTRRASVLINFIILLTYPTNFFIYCTMSTQFRTTFRAMFRRTTNLAPAAEVAVAPGRGEAILMMPLNNDETATSHQL